MEAIADLDVFVAKAQAIRNELGRQELAHNDSSGASIPARKAVQNRAVTPQ